MQVSEKMIDAACDEYAPLAGYIPFRDMLPDTQRRWRTNMYAALSAALSAAEPGPVEQATIDSMSFGAGYLKINADGSKECIGPHDHLAPVPADAGAVEAKPVYWVAETRMGYVPVESYHPSAIPLYRTAQPAGEGVKIKALEWKPGYRDFQVKIQQASTGPHYQIRELDGVVWLDADNHQTIYPSVDAAKAASQADYEARILSALSPSDKREE